MIWAYPYCDCFFPPTALSRDYSYYHHYHNSEGLLKAMQKLKMVCTINLVILLLSLLKSPPQRRGPSSLVHFSPRTPATWSVDAQWTLDGTHGPFWTSPDTCRSSRRSRPPKKLKSGTNHKQLTLFFFFQTFFDVFISEIRLCEHSF